MAVDHYRVLQVDPSADAEAIHAAYRRLARLYHPDLNPLPEAAAQMRSINSAYAVLSDARQRAAYDARRYLPRTTRPTAPVTVSYPRPVSQHRYASPTTVANARAYTPTPLQRHVDRVVAVVGVLLLIGIAFYTINVIPYGERLLQEGDRPQQPIARTALQTSQDHGTAPVPQRVGADVGLHSFPGTVLVAPQSLPPFSSLPVIRIDANGQGIARYAIYYGDWSVGGAIISGLVGRTAFDSAVPTLPACDREAPYCVGTAPGQAPGGQGLELFRDDDLVAQYPAVVIHRVCCNGTFWTVAWYEPQANMSYSVDVSRALAGQFGRADVDPDNLSAAHTVGSLAKQLVRLP